MIKINDKFKPLFEEKTRYYIITGERGASKSFTVNLYLTLKLLQLNQTILFTRFTLASAKDSIIPEFTEKIELLELDGKFDLQTHDITNHTNNSNILFRGIKTSAGIQTAKLKSLANVNIWVLDEAEELVEESIFDKIDLSVRAKGQTNMIVLILNPASRRHWIYNRFFKNKVKEDFNGIHKNTTYIYTTLEDNYENINDELLKELRELKETNPEQYKKRMGTSWLDEEEDIVFNYSQLNWYNKIDYLGAEIVAYTDIATVGIDYLCMVVGALIEDKVFIIDVIYTQKDSNYTMPKMISLYDKYNIQTSLVESNAAGLMFLRMMLDKAPHLKGRAKPIPSTTNKHTRIIIQADDILDNFYFKKTDNKEYNLFIEHLTSYRNDGKFKIDDSVDSLAGLSKQIMFLKKGKRLNKLK